MQQEPYRDPCVPSPCGPFSQCRDVGGTAQCSCLPRYYGSPPQCHPECTINADCSPLLACINERCIDPCPGSCGINAQCKVVNHVPNCFCPDRYTGDPFTNCYPKPGNAPTFSSFFTKSVFRNYLVEIYKLKWIVLNFPLIILCTKNIDRLLKY